MQILHSLLLLSAASAEKEDSQQQQPRRPPSLSFPLQQRWGISTERNNSCTALSGDCGECIRSPECAWCKDPGWSAGRGGDGFRRSKDNPRCDLRSW